MNLWDVPSEPVDNYPDAVAVAAKKAFCFATPFVAGLALVKGITAPLAPAIMWFGAQECGLFGGGDNVPRVTPFGGQCEGVMYLVTFVIKNDGQPEREGPQDSSGNINPRRLIGPIKGVVGSRPGPWDIVHGNPEQLSRVLNQNNPSTEYVRIGNVTREDGQPDDCGQPPVQYPVQPPDPGEPPYPPIVLPPELSPILVDVVIEGDTVIKFPIEIGEINVNVDDLFPININIDDRSYSLSPTLELNPDFFFGFGEDGEPIDLSEIKGALALIQEEQQEAEALLRSVRDELYRDVSTLVSRGECGDDGPTTVEVSGNGFAFLAAAMTQESSARYAQSSSLCPSDGGGAEDVPAFEIASGSAGVNHVEFIEIPNETKMVALIVSGNPPGLRVYRNAGSQVHAKFGFISEALDMGIEPCPFEQQYVYTREHLLELSPYDEVTRFVRIALTEGLSWQLQDVGVR